MNKSAFGNILKAGLISALSLTPLLASEVPTGERQAEIKHMLKHDCGSCHGMTMLGGLGPALDKPRMQQFSVDYIKNTILYGRPGTPMPPWKPFLTEQEAHWLTLEIRGQE